MNIDKINIDFLKNALFPAKCDFCNNFVDTVGLCAECWSKITWITEPKCKICGLPFSVDIDQICTQCISNKPYFDKAISVFVYNEFSKQIILRFKHSDATYLYEQLASWMYRSATSEITNADIIIPVPIHFLKRLKRKYNQSELLAQEVSQLSGIKYEPRILMKIKKTLPQEGLSGKERRKNIVGSFGIDENFKDLIVDKNIVLIDDVFTTGATVNECSKVLKKFGAKTITVVTLARVVLF